MILGPPVPSRILTPRDLVRRSGVERYEVPGGGALLVEVAAGDRVTVVNAEGGQVAEVLAAGRSGVVDLGILGAAGNCDGEGLKGLDCWRRAGDGEAADGAGAAGD